MRIARMCISGRAITSGRLRIASKRSKSIPIPGWPPSSAARCLLRSGVTRKPKRVTASRWTPTRNPRFGTKRCGDSKHLRARAMINAPKPSHARLALLILEGYVYVLVIVGIFVGSLALLVWGLLDRRPFVALLALAVGVPVTLTTAAAIRSLFFRLPEPQGVPVSRAEAPALYDMVTDVRKQVQSPKVHRILIDGSFNAAASQ